MSTYLSVYQSLQLNKAFFFFSSRRRHTRSKRDWSSDVCSSDLGPSLNNALQKAKRKQLLKIIIVSLLVVLIVLPILYKTGNYFAMKSTERLHDRLFLYHAIAELNIQIDYQVTRNSSLFDGNIIT